ncbi:hypothetical protein WN51_06536 [Melipona quadrifasciata]|uniref:Uncharacterized protein n=1 Tax=Melipona quadrifasciata TaxID=166423 RepID=A0A0M8ZRI8_9HYME|nr:hypothetical protein WN51_06536 [Melipona quadrifasciata]
MRQSSKTSHGPDHKHHQITPAFRPLEGKGHGGENQGLEVYSTPPHESRDPNQPIANFRCISVAPEEGFWVTLKSLSVVKFPGVPSFCPIISVQQTVCTLSQRNSKAWSKKSSSDPTIPRLRVSNTRLAQAASGCAPSVEVLPIFDVKQAACGEQPARRGGDWAQPSGVVITTSVWGKDCHHSPTDDES